MAFLLKRDGFDIEFRQHISSRCTGLDSQFGEVFGDLEFLEVQGGFECHFDDLRFAIRIDGKIDDSGAGFALREIVFLIFRDAGDIESLHEIGALLAITIDDIIDSTIVAAFEDRDMEYIRPDEQLLRDLNNLIFTVLMEDDDIVDIRAIEEEFIFLESGTDESFRAVDIEFLIILHHCLDIDGAEVTHLGATRIRLAVFALEHLKPRDSIVRQMVEILNTSFDFLLEVLHQFVSFLGVELGDTNHSDLEKFLDILGADFANELRFERREGLIHESD